jgi:hypothetical protein
VEYKNLVRDFAQRTLKNLEFIEVAVKQEPNAQVFEVTQLINSTLGLLVFPQQRFLDNIPKIPLQELRSDGWPIPTMADPLPRGDNLRELVRCLRNGIAHCNLEFISDGQALIGFRIWNCVNGSRTKNWEACLRLHELREFTRKFIALLQETDR